MKSITLPKEIKDFEIGGTIPIHNQKGKLVGHAHFMKFKTGIKDNKLFFNPTFKGSTQIKARNKSEWKLSYSASTKGNKVDKILLTIEMRFQQGTIKLK